MKIYTDMKGVDRVLFLQELEKVSSIRWASGSKPTGYTPDYRYYGIDRGKLIAGPDANPSFTLYHYTAFLAKCKKAFPKTKPVPLFKMTKAQLLEAIKDKDANIKMQIKAEESLCEEIDSLSQKLSEAETHNDELQTEIDSLKNDNTQLRESVEHRKSDVVEQKKRVAMREEELQKVEHELANLKKNIMLLSGIAMGVKG